MLLTALVIDQDFTRLNVSLIKKRKIILASCFKYARNTFHGNLETLEHTAFI